MVVLRREFFLLNLFCLSVSTVIFFSFMFIVNWIGIEYYPFIHHLAYRRSIYMVVFNPSLDRCLLLASLTLALTTFFAANLEVEPRELFSRILLYELSLFTLIETLTLLHWVGVALSMDASFLKHISELELQLSNILYPFAPFLMAILLFTWAWKPPIEMVEVEVETSEKRYTVSLERVVSKLVGTRGYGEKHSEPDASRVKTGLLLLFSIASSVFITLYAYLPSVNPESKLVGSDTPIYLNWLGEMVEGDWMHAAHYALRSDRPVYLIFMYLINALTQSPFNTMKVLQPILASLLAVSTYWFMRVGSGSRMLSASSAIFAALSYNTTVGVYSAINANWLALSLTLLTLGSLLKGLSSHAKAYLAAATLLSTIVLFTHPWTWALTIATAALYGILTFAASTFKRSAGNGGKEEAAWIAAFLALNLVADRVRSILTVGAGLEAVQRVAAQCVGLENAGMFWENLLTTLKFYVGGFFSYQPILILALIGALSIVNHKEGFNRLILSWLTVASIGAVSTPYTLQWRLLYIAPFPILSAVGFHNLVNRGETSPSQRLLAASLILALLNWSLRSVFNIV